LTHQKISSFQSLTSEFRVSPEVLQLNLSFNRIVNFVGLSSAFTRLTRLHVDDNPIHSFEGCLTLPSLNSLSLRNTPISLYRHFKLMCLVAFGDGLASINGDVIPARHREDAAGVRDAASPQLRTGSVIIRLQPLRMRQAIREGPHGGTGPPPSHAVLCSDFLSTAPKLFGSRRDPPPDFAAHLADLRRSFPFHRGDDAVDPLVDARSRSSVFAGGESDPSGQPPKCEEESGEQTDGESAGCRGLVRDSDEQMEHKTASGPGENVLNSPDMADAAALGHREIVEHGNGPGSEESRGAADQGSEEPATEVVEPDNDKCETESDGDAAAALAEKPDEEDDAADKLLHSGTVSEGESAKEEDGGTGRGSTDPEEDAVVKHEMAQAVSDGAGDRIESETVSVDAGIAPKDDGAELQTAAEEVVGIAMTGNGPLADDEKPEEDVAALTDAAKSAGAAEEEEEEESVAISPISGSRVVHDSPHEQNSTESGSAAGDRQAAEEEEEDGVEADVPDLDWEGNGALEQVSEGESLAAPVAESGGDGSSFGDIDLDCISGEGSVDRGE
jgi:hypothetical protein